MTGEKRDVHPSLEWGAGGLGTAARVLVGAGSVIFGLYVGGSNLAEYEADGFVSLFSAVVIVGGVILLAQVWQRQPVGAAGRIAGTAVGAVGLVGGLMIPMREVCCDAVWNVTLGFPLPWTIGDGETSGEAFQHAWGGNWDPLSVFLDVAFWLHAGLIVAVVIGLLQRGSERDRGGASRIGRPGAS